MPCYKNAIHEKNIYKEYIGVDACAANLMRPAIYGHIITLRFLEKKMHHAIRSTVKVSDLLKAGFLQSRGDLLM